MRPCDDVLRCEEERAAAIQAGDVDRLRELTSPDYVHVDVNGALRNREEFLLTLQSREAVFTRYHNEDVQVRLHHPVAVVSGRLLNEHRRSDGEVEERVARFVRIWVCEDGGWRNLHHQATRFAPAPRA